MTRTQKNILYDRLMSRVSVGVGVEGGKRSADVRLIESHIPRALEICSFAGISITTRYGGAVKNQQLEPKTPVITSVSACG
jgi:hypothetical protein